MMCIDDDDESVKSTGIRVSSFEGLNCNAPDNAVKTPTPGMCRCTKNTRNKVNCSKYENVSSHSVLTDSRRCPARAGYRLEEEKKW
jgi:hypothetical protein